MSAMATVMYEAIPLGPHTCNGQEDLFSGYKQQNRISTRKEFYKIHLCN